VTGALHVIGVDPGPIPGVVSLDFDGELLGGAAVRDLRRSA
jgi:predicted RNase H-like nuclease (RuvC/YqgF family)